MTWTSIRSISTLYEPIEHEFTDHDDSNTEIALYRLERSDSSKFVGALVVLKSSAWAHHHWFFKNGLLLWVTWLSETWPWVHDWWATMPTNELNWGHTLCHAALKTLLPPRRRRSHDQSECCLKNRVAHDSGITRMAASNCGTLTYIRIQKHKRWHQRSSRRQQQQHLAKFGRANPNTMLKSDLFPSACQRK